LVLVFSQAVQVVVPKYPSKQDVVVAAALQVFAPVPVHYAHYPVVASKKYPLAHVLCARLEHEEAPAGHAKHYPFFN